VAFLPKTSASRLRTWTEEVGSVIQTLTCLAYEVMGIVVRKFERIGLRVVNDLILMMSPVENIVTK
jgi:hypothetical protein